MQICLILLLPLLLLLLLLLHNEFVSERCFDIVILRISTVERLFFTAEETGDGKKSEKETKRKKAVCELCPDGSRGKSRPCNSVYHNK